MLNDALKSSFPPCMHSRNNMGVLIPQKNRYAVGCLDTHACQGQIGRQSIDTIHGECLLQGSEAEEGVVDDDSADAVHLMVGHEESGYGQ